MTAQSLPRTLLRFTLYSFLLLAWLLILPVITRFVGMDAFREGHIVEWFQFATVSLAAVVLAVAAWRFPQWREMLSLLAALAALAAVREQDALLDRAIPYLLGWKVPALLCLFAGVTIALRNLPAFTEQLQRFVRCPGFGILWAGVLTVVCAAQLIGHGDLIKAIMADAYDANVKRVVEESFEAFGYLLLLIGSIETRVFARETSSVAPPVAAEATAAAEQPAVGGAARVRS